MLSEDLAMVKHINNLRPSLSKPFKRDAFLLFLLVGLTAIAFYPALKNSFVFWDDQYYVTQNPLIQNPSWVNLKALMTQIISLNYHPVTMMSLWLNAKCSGIDQAAPFIFTNIGIHLFNVILVFCLCRNLFKDSKWIPLFVALIFGLHPMHVESVVWVSERKDVLYALFFFGSAILYSKYADQNHWSTYTFALFLFVMACLSKAMAVSLVPILMTIDYLKNRKLPHVKAIVEKIPFVVIAMLFGLIAVDVQSGDDFFGFLQKSLEEKAILLDNFTISDKFVNAAFGIFFYIKKFLLPFNLSAFHPTSLLEEVASFVPSIGVSIFFVISLVWSFFKKPEIFFGLSFFILSLILVLQFIPVGSIIVAERYTYLPYIGLSIAIGALLDPIQRKYEMAIYAGLLVYALFLLFHTQAQAKIWKNQITLFSQAVELYPTNIQARKYLASGFWANQQIDSALFHLEFAIKELGSTSSSTLELLANCYADKGDKVKALEFYQKAIEQDPENISALYHKAITIYETNPSQAIEDFNQCEASSNEYIKSLIYVPRGRSYGILKQYKRAILDFNKAIEKEPNNGANYLDRGMTYYWMGESQKAQIDFQKARQLDATLNIPNF